MLCKFILEIRDKDRFVIPQNEIVPYSYNYLEVLEFLQIFYVIFSFNFYDRKTIGLKNIIIRPFPS